MAKLLLVFHQNTRYVRDSAFGAIDHGRSTLIHTPEFVLFNHTHHNNVETFTHACLLINISVCSGRCINQFVFE